jgi:hypothetical protein
LRWLSFYFYIFWEAFLSWAASNGWNLKTLMEYVGWTDAKSAMRYIDTIDPFTAEHAIQITAMAAL